MSGVTRPRMVTQNKTLHFSKRVKWITVLYGGIPQQVLGSTSTRGVVISSLVKSPLPPLTLWSDDITALSP